MQFVYDKTVSKSKYLLLALIILGVLFVLGASIFSKYKLGSHNPKAAGDTLLFGDAFDGTLSQWQLSPSAHGIVRQSTVNRRSAPNSLTTSINAGVDVNTINSATHRFASPINLARAWVFIYDTGFTDPQDDSYAFFQVSDDSGAHRLSIGIKPSISTTDYTYCPTQDPRSCRDTHIARRPNQWVRFKIFVTPKGSYAKIDDRTLADMPGKYDQASNTLYPAINADLTFIQKITVGVSHGSSFARAYFDDLGMYDWQEAPANKDVALQLMNSYLTTYGNFDPVAAMNRLSQIKTAGSYCQCWWSGAGSCPGNNPNLPNPIGLRFNGDSINGPGMQGVIDTYRYLYTLDPQHYSNYMALFNAAYNKQQQANTVLNSAIPQCGGQGPQQISGDGEHYIADPENPQNLKLQMYQPPEF